MLKDIIWETPDKNAPLAIPKCGFSNENCPPDEKSSK